ncbi:TetR/AcrR family transcriptional regulator [Novosphingobium sp. BL-8H]|uniref:TetR/AcrR family transcriptional regulator n=1 Tax=Novosphingobium sp. BL-8H TaxID=3127640 RepID=UPI003756FA7D
MVILLSVARSVPCWLRTHGYQENKQLITCFGCRACYLSSGQADLRNRTSMPAKSSPSKSADAVRRDYRPAAERRVEIIAAAQAEFIRANFAGARTREIADAAGVNQATLFKHFPTKEDLFEAAVMRPLIEAMEGMHGRIETYRTARTPAEMGELARESTIRHLEDMQRILPLLTTALFSDLESGRRVFQQQLEPLIRARGEVLSPLAKDGLSPEFLGLASFGMMFAVALERWFNGRTDELAATASQFNQLYTAGFAREKPGPTADDGDPARS